MPSIKQNTVTEHWKKGLETRPFKAFFLKTSHTTPSENFRFCKVLRNNNFWRERERERERERDAIDRIFAKAKKCGVLALFYNN